MNIYPEGEDKQWDDHDSAAKPGQCAKETRNQRTNAKSERELNRVHAPSTPPYTVDSASHDGFLMSVALDFTDG
jgi:hypothetical protein